MKKIFAVLLAAAMLLSLCACAQKNDVTVKEEVKESAVITTGLIDNIFDFNVYLEHRKEKHNDIAMIPEYLTYPNLSTAMLALEKGEVGMLSLSKSTADYLLARNDKFKLMDFALDEDEVVFNKISMLTTDANTEIYELLDSGIKQLKADGTLDKLIEEELKAYITSDPTPEKLPKFDGAKTYRIAITGDKPPMDFVTADGKAAGFNVALLSEIANIAQVNFEIVQIDSGARLTALATDTVDAVFWVVSANCPYCDEVIETAPEGTLITEDYFTDDVAFLTLK
ncbi:MAG: transporter substrate-binding domain-containing protein [Christensenellales bacterium]|nr:transporter substrate-binding domain-containing protein [Christensenellales bacterium]